MTWPPLRPDEVLLPDPDPTELLLRSIAPEHVDEGDVSLNAFVPSSAERVSGRLSGARETKQTAAGLRAEQEALRPGRCAEIRGVMVEEIESAGPLRTVDDSALVANATGHSYIDIRLLEAADKATKRVTRGTLALAATNRGALG